MGNQQGGGAPDTTAVSMSVSDCQQDYWDHTPLLAADTDGQAQEDQLVRVLEKNTELTIQNTDLQKQVQQLQNVSADCRGLPGAAQAGKQVDTLESILKQMREATDRRKELEREHAEAVNLLREKQSEVQRSKVTATASDKAKSYETIEALQSKIRELEKKAELQNVRHEELLLEMASIKRSAQGSATSAGVTGATSSTSVGTKLSSSVGSTAWKSRSASTNQEVQTSPESGTSTPDSGRLESSRTTPLTDSLLEQHSTTSRGLTRAGAQTPGYVQKSSGGPFHLPMWSTPPANVRSACTPSSLPLVSGHHHHQHQQHQLVAVRSGSPVQPAVQPGTAEIDRIMAKIEQDNRILAELDKTRSTIGEAHSRAIPAVPSDSWDGTNYLKVPQITFGPNHSLEDPSGLTAGTVSGVAPTPPPSVAVAAPAPAAAPPAAAPTGTDPMTGYMVMPQTAMGMVPAQYVMPVQLQPVHNYGAGTTPQARLMPQIPAGVGPSTIPTILTTQYDLDARNNYLNGNLVLSALQEQQQLADNKLMDMLEIPGKGRCFVYIARYSYDPLTQSPNENPEAELAVNAGDYVLVWGPMDEDGFCDGELLDGRRGLVPSNYIQKLVGDDLLEFHQSVVQGLRDCDDSASTNVAHDMDLTSAAHDVVMMDEVLTKQQRLLTADYSLAELEDILEEEDEALSDQTGEGPVPAPKQLTLERQLNKSVLIGWNPPDACPPAAIDSYHVYVDGVLKTTVKASERTRALVEGVDSTRPHRISVRSITPNRRTSRDAACTMVIGKDVPQGPTNVKAGNVTSTSAVISWLPANSNHQHVVCVNNVEVRTVKPGVYRHTITGLAPNTVYRVTVRAKNIRAPSFDEKSSSQQMERCSAHIDFRTLPKGLPDPPVDIQVEPGPQDGTLLVTWLPVAHNNTANNGAPVTGYAVYADGKKVTDVDSPTGDHALIDINKLLGLNPKQVTVRTKSRDSQSSDSAPTAIPSNALKGKMSKDMVDGTKGERRQQRERYGSAVPAHMRHRALRVDGHGQVIIEPDENLSDKEIYPANHMNIPSIEITKDSASEANFSEDDYLDGRRGAIRGHHHPPGPGMGGHYVPRSHVERGRPPVLPHERGRMDRPPPRRDRDDRDQYYMEPPRGRHGDRGYRGGGPPPGRPMGPQPPPHHGRDKRTRWFVALYDYDPINMSPNPDACEEELPFNEGDPIKIFGDKDADGFYWGECRGRQGFVPHNMVVEVQEMPKNSMETGRVGPHSRDRWGDIYANMPVKKMIALYDYDPQELSPNVDAEVELSFNTGNIIYVYGDMDDDGFYMGELDGVRGLVPSNFLTEAPPDYAGGNGRPPRGRAGGHGPGARGPPPPPRDGRDRRKDACPALSHIDYRGDNMPQGPAGQRSRGGLRADRRGGSSRPEPPMMDQPPSSMTGGTSKQQPPPSANQQQASQQQQQQQQQQQTTSSGGTSSSTKPMKGIPSVVPDFVIPNNKESPTSGAVPQSGPKFPDTPNLMQKFSEMTGGADTSVDNIISKGKELIFMKFGLGK